MPGTIQILLLNREVKNTFERVYTTHIGQLAQTICPSATAVKKKIVPIIILLDALVYLEYSVPGER